MAPKKKSQKIALSDFLMDDKLGSWADEMDSLPSAPAPRADGERGDDGDFMSRPNRGEFSGPPREELPLPTQAPWTAFVGNLAFDVGEGEVSSFFTGLKLVSVKIINDMEGKPKGFGYVEFGTLDMLKEGLGRSGEQLAGRAVRVSVAEPPKGAGSRLGGSPFSASAAAAEEKSSWRREGPLPPIESSSNNGPRQSSYNNSPSVPEAERDWGAARGSKFVPSAEPVRTPGGGPPRTGGFVSESGAAAEAASQWRSNKPVATGPVEREAPPHQRAGGPGGPGGFRPANEGPLSPADTEDQWTRGGRFVPTVERSAPSSRRGSHEFQSRGASPFPPSNAPADESPSDWRSNMRKGSSGPGSSAERSPIPSATSSPQPASRRPLTLLPRSTSSTGTGSGVLTPSPSNPTSPSASTPSSPAPANAAPLAPAQHKPSPFGAARAVDNAAREKEVEEKLAKQEQESRERRQKEKEARDLKAKTFVRAPPVGGDRRGNNNNNKPTSPPPAGASSEEKVAAPVVVVEGEGEEKKIEQVASPKKTNISLGAPVVEKKSFAAAPSFSALEVEGGEDEDVEEVTEKVAKIEV